MSRVNVAAILARLDKQEQARLRQLAAQIPATTDSLLPAPPKSRPKHCAVCNRVFSTASQVCPRWEQHKYLYETGNDVPVPGDATDNRNYIGGWRGAGRAVLKGTKIDNRDRRVIGGKRAAQRMQAMKAKAAHANAEAKARAEREAAYQAIVWPTQATDLQKRAYYLVYVEDLSYAKAGKKMGGLAKNTIREHYQLAKKHAHLA